MMEIKPCVYVCMCTQCLYECIFIYVLCKHIYTDIHHGSLSSSGRNQYDNCCIAHLIESLWWKLRQHNNHHQFMPCEYLPVTYTQAFSYSFPVQTVCACYVHSTWLLVWVLIVLFDCDLIHICGGWDLWNAGYRI